MRPGEVAWSPIVEPVPAAPRAMQAGRQLRIDDEAHYTNIQLPDAISAALEKQWDDVPRRSLEAIAVEAYRSGALTEALVRRLLGSEARFEVHALLKEHHVATTYGK